MKYTISFDYDTIQVHQKGDTELKDFRIDRKMKQNYKATYFGRTILWTKKGEDGQHRIYLPTTLRDGLLEW